MAIEEYLTRGDDARIDEFDWGEIAWLDGDELTTGAGLSAARVTIRAGERNAAHRHPNCSEVLYLLAGELDHTLGEERTLLEPGDLLHVPQDAPHQATSTGTEDAVALVVYDSETRQIEFVD